MEKSIMHPVVKHPKELVKKELKGVSKINDWIAVIITKAVGTMWCAYAFLLFDLLTYHRLLSPET